MIYATLSGVSFTSNTFKSTSCCAFVQHLRVLNVYLPNSIINQVKPINSLLEENKIKLSIKAYFYCFCPSILLVFERHLKLIEEKILKKTENSKLIQLIYQFFLPGSFNHACISIYIDLLRSVN